MFKEYFECNLLKQPERENFETIDNYPYNMRICLLVWKSSSNGLVLPIYMCLTRTFQKGVYAAMKMQTCGGGGSGGMVRELCLLSLWRKRILSSKKKK